MLLYLDESGDPGFQLDKGVSPFFVVTLLAVEERIILDDIVERLRVDAGFTRNPEFRFSSTEPHVRERFLQEVGASEIMVRALVVDKLRIPDPTGYSRRSVYQQFLVRLLSSEPEIVEGSLLTLDRRIKSNVARRNAITALRQDLLAAGSIRLREIRYKDSRSDNLLQVADMLSGAIYHRFRRGDHTYLRHVERQTRIVELPEIDRTP